MTETANKAEHIQENTVIFGDEIELIDLLLIIWKWKYLILAGTLVCALVAAIVSSKKQPTYLVGTLLKLNPIIILDRLQEFLIRAYTPPLSYKFFKVFHEYKYLAMLFMTVFALFSIIFSCL